jgi:hypothetical protein
MLQNYHSKNENAVGTVTIIIFSNIFGMISAAQKTICQ